MKLTKLSLFTLSLGLCLSAKAQTNASYDRIYYSGYSSQGGNFNVRCMAPLENGGNVIVSCQSAMLGTFMLSVVNNAGDVVVNRQIWPVNTPAGFFVIGASSVVECEDNGFLVAGYAFNDNDYGVSAVKLDPAGNVMWTKFYQIGSNTISYSFGGFSIVKTNNGPNGHDSYVLVCTGESPAGIASDSEPFAVKIDNGGNLIWARKYIDPNRYLFPPMTNVMHYTYTASYIPAKGEIAIAGRRTEIWNLTTAFSLFLFKIDEATGNPVGDYHTYKLPGYTVDGRSLDDGENLLIGFTNGNTNAFSGRAASTIGLMKFDYNLNLLAERHYIKDIPDQAEDYITGISKSASNEWNDPKMEHSFVVSAKSSKVIGGLWSPFIFKVNSKTLLPFAGRTLPEVGIDAMNHTQTRHPVFGTEEYNIFSDFYSYNPFKYNIRISKFDEMLDNCNAMPLILADSPMFSRQQYKTQYLGIYSANEYDLAMTSFDDDLTVDGCMIDDHHKRQQPFVAGNTLLEGNAALRLYPNMLKANQAGSIMIACDKTLATGPLQLNMVDMNGRIVMNQQIKTNGATEYPFTVPALAPGLYMLRVTGASGALLGTFKLTAF